MRPNQVRIILVVLSLLSLVENSTIGQNTSMLPWEVIAEKYDTGSLFCSIQIPVSGKNKDENIVNYAITTNTSIIILPSSIKVSKGREKTKLHLSRCHQNKWENVRPLVVQFDSNHMVIDCNTVTEGFYDFLISRDENNICKNNCCYAVITADWKKDILSYCRNSKEQIESNPDPQLICSSLAVSHFDKLMELVSKSSILSEDIFDTLSKTITAKTEYEHGNCPDLVKGLNKIRLKRFKGCMIEEFVVYVPETYNDTKAEAVFLYPESGRAAARRNYLPHSGFIDIWWHTVDNKDINWKNYRYFFEILKQKINIDENKVYVHGECGNGLPAMSLALNFPDQWAACSISLGNTYPYLAGNALNLPLIFVKGFHEEDYLVGYYDFAVECFKYFNCRFFKYDKSLDISEVRGTSVPTEIRNLSPDRVFYTIESLANSQAYWIRINGREDENFIASIDATIQGQSILVKADNVDAYSLNLKLAPIDCNKSVEIIENGKHLGCTNGPFFIKQSSKYNNAVYIKKQFFSGPVTDVFTDPYVVIWTGDDKNKQFARILAGTGPCFSDVNFSPDLISTNNVVFVGRLDISKHFMKIADKLPVFIEERKLTADSTVYEGDLGTIFIYPNPLNPKRYITVFSGTTEKAMDLIGSAWERIKSDNTADIGIFTAAKNNQIKWIRCEKFNTIWGWHDGWSVPLAKVVGTYPRWKWHQLVAKSLREQLHADVAIYGDPFKSSDLPSAGEITLRKLSEIFKNDWIVKISIKGKYIKDLLTISFKANSSREAPPIAIEGAGLLKQNNIPCVDEFNDEQLYTVALPYKAVNGTRTGIRLNDYKLVGEDWLIHLLKNYLIGNGKIDIDAELTALTFNGF